MSERFAREIPVGVDLYIATGPTAVGKTEITLRWAEAAGAEIVSCDSLLFYRGMDIGTAKPTPEERARVPHHLIDVADPSEPWNVHQYLEAAVAAVADIHRRGRKILVTGGSGFYLKSFLAPVVDRVEVPEAVLSRVAALEQRGLEALQAELLTVDPGAAEALDFHNPRRVARALERCLATGRSVRQLREEMGRASFPFARCRRHVCLLQRDRADLDSRIERRVDQMLRAGLVEEVERLLGQGLGRNPSASAAIGYRETIRHIAGELSPEELRDEIIRNTKRLVKKQMTWFRHQLASPVILNLTGTGGGPEELFPGSAGG